MSRTYVVTGGAGFIGSALVRHLVNDLGVRVVTVDALSYAGDMARLESVASSPLHRFEHLDVNDQAALERLFAAERPHGVFHLAAETHVDRSIDGPEQFALSNTLGTLRLLEAARRYWQALPEPERAAFRFVNVSTDEVYGSLGATGIFTETTAYDPRSPYSASKAAADHLANAYFTTYGLPTITTHASNNYGPYQFPEKLIPLALSRALAGEPVPLYGDGSNVRDWLHVDDHARGLVAVMERGTPGETYLMGGNNERANLAVLNELFTILNELEPGPADYRELITLVPDRPGHDQRYAVDSSKAERELGWDRQVPFQAGLRSTVEWYLANQEWVDAIRNSRYDLGRLGTSPEAKPEQRAEPDAKS